jgi:hypothetical protein
MKRLSNNETPVSGSVYLGDTQLHGGVNEAGDPITIIDHNNTCTEAELERYDVRELQKMGESGLCASKKERDSSRPSRTGPLTILEQYEVNNSKAVEKEIFKNAPGHHFSEWFFADAVDPIFSELVSNADAIVNAPIIDPPSTDVFKFTVDKVTTPMVSSSTKKSNGITDTIKDAGLLPGDVFYYTNNAKLGTVEIEVMADFKLKARGELYDNINHLARSLENNQYDRGGKAELCKYRSNTLTTLIKHSGRASALRNAESFDQFDLGE